MGTLPGVFLEDKDLPLNLNNRKDAGELVYNFPSI
jgi:hypothetical protein